MSQLYTGREREKEGSGQDISVPPSLSFLRGPTALEVVSMRKIIYVGMPGAGREKEPGEGDSSNRTDPVLDKTTD